MRISTDSIYSNMIANAGALQSQTSAIQDELSSGLSFTQPSDNPTGMTQALNLVSEDRQVAQFGANANVALQIGQASSSGLGQFQQVADQAGQLATEANNGTVGASQLQGYAPQVDQLLEQALQLGNSQFNGSYIYAGTATTQPPFVATRDASGQITSIAYDGNLSQASIPVSSDSTVTPGTSGATNQGLASFMNQLVSLRDSLQAGNSSGITAIQTQLSNSDDSIVQAAADSAAVQSRIQSVQTAQSASGQGIESLLSNQTSSDVASATIKLTEAETAYQATLASAAKIMQNSILNYIY
jgi:flagellar hook-associated protein 3 FlgL